MLVDSEKNADRTAIGSHVHPLVVKENNNNNIIRSLEYKKLRKSIYYYCLFNIIIK